MKLTKSKLKQLIKEELEAVLKEDNYPCDAAHQALEDILNQKYKAITDERWNEMGHYIEKEKEILEANPDCFKSAPDSPAPSPDSPAKKPAAGRGLEHPPGFYADNPGSLY
jgi:hypothetical protein